MASAWVYQDAHQVAKYGSEAASWYVGWVDPGGKRRCKSCGPGPKGKRNAEKLRQKTEAELLTGTYQSNAKKTWQDFRTEFEAKILSGMGDANRRLTLESLDHFERLVNPVRVAAIMTSTVDEFRAKRRSEPGKKKGASVSPATVNKDLRHLRAVLRRAHSWGYLPRVPDFTFEKEAKKLPTYVAADHFACIYRACDLAKLPTGLPCSPADWWRALLVMGYMTGWRIGDMLGLRRDDLDLEHGYAISRADVNKGKREERVKLHPVVVAHLQQLKHFEPVVFPWYHNRRTLDVVFARIQQAAGIHLACPERHEHTKTCHVYGFHDLRRAFATLNAEKLTPDALQALMRHTSYQTTQRYINYARQLDEAVASLHVPDFLRTKAQ